MRFWDSSALVPLIVEQPASVPCRSLLRDDPRAVVWAFSRLEVLGALHRLRREGALPADKLSSAEARLARHARRWCRVNATDDVADQAARIVREHPLTSADALQLAAALVAADHRPRNQVFVALDDRLLAAAAAVGFDALRPG